MEERHDGKKRMKGDDCNTYNTYLVSVNLNGSLTHSMFHSLQYWRTIVHLSSEYQCRVIIVYIFHEHLISIMLWCVGKKKDTIQGRAKIRFQKSCVSLKITYQMKFYFAVTKSQTLQISITDTIMYIVQCSIVEENFCKLGNQLFINL